MKTTAERKLSELRVQASEFIHGRLGKAPFLAVKYSRTGALAVCVWQDGVREYLWVDYTDLMPEGQHGRAMEYIQRMAQGGGSSPRSCGTSTSSPERFPECW